MSDLSTPASGRLSGRTKEDIDRDFREHCRKAAQDILLLGYDLIEMKEICGHGEFLSWLNEVGWKERTAQNYMRVAKTWNENPSLMSMGYTRTVALLAAPAEVQEMAADGQLDGASAAEIRRLSKELRDSEQANKSLVSEIEKRDETVNGLLDQLKDADKKIRERDEKLRERAKDPEIVEKVVEKVPEDYELIKRQLRLAEDAAEDAEKRAADAVRQAQEAMAGQAEPFEGPSVEAFLAAVNAFLAAAGHLPYAEDWLRSLGKDDRRAVKMFADSVWHWAESMLKAVEADRLTVIPGEGAVSGE